MTRKILFCLIGIMFMIGNTFAAGYECLGTLCYVNVNLSTDPVDGGYLTYTIPVPDEGLGPYAGVQGPGSPVLANNLGTTVDLKLRKSHLALEADGKNCQLYVDLLVNKWSLGFGHYTTTKPSGSQTYPQCYYRVILVIEQ